MAALCVSFRIYSLMRVIRESSTFHRYRRQIQRNVHPSPKFGWSLAVKVFLTENASVAIVLLIFLCLLVVSAYWVHVCERESQPDIFGDYSKVMWFTVRCWGVKV